MSNEQILSIAMVAKVIFLMVMMLQVAPIMAWVERRGMAILQKRLGPDRIGPLGLLQSIADAIKFIFKEDVSNKHVDPFYYPLAPLLSMVPAFMSFAVIPFAAPIQLGEVTLDFHVANLNVGLLYILAIASLGVYGIIVAGWSSRNKYALLGSLRSSAQMISYELSMGLALVGILLCFSSVHLGDIVEAQKATLFTLGPVSIPKWGFFLQPLGCLIFIVSAFAETNRLPFDLPEGESEIIAGYFLEYGSMKFAIFMMAEYINMVTASGLISSLFFGGYQLLPGMSLILEHSGLVGESLEWLRVLMQFGSLLIKIGFFMWFFVWVRWTLPRFRYDQLMDLGWKVMLPLALANVFVTASLIYLGVM